MLPLTPRPRSTSTIAIHSATSTREGPRHPEGGGQQPPRRLPGDDDRAGDPPYRRGRPLGRDDAALPRRPTQRVRDARPLHRRHIYITRGFDAEALLALIEAEQITQIFGLPMMYRAMLDHPDIARRDLSSLRLALYAMAPMPDTDLTRAMDVFGCDFALGFGQTEMNPITTIFLPEQQLSHRGSVGTPVPNVQVGQRTRVVRGPQQGRHQDRGRERRVDRDRESSLRGGGAYPGRGRDRARPPAMDGSHYRRGCPRPGSDLTEHDVLDAAGRRLARFKQPKQVVLREDLPRTATGKIQKNVLRDEPCELYAGPAVDPTSAAS